MDKVTCRICGVKILDNTANRTGGRCMPCFRQNLDFSALDNSDEGKKKIYQSLVEYVSHYSMNIRSWQHTKIAEVHSEIEDAGIKYDHVVVSCFFDESNWWLATVDELLGKFDGKLFTFDPKNNYDVKYGNFKRYRSSETLEIRYGKSDILKLHYETGEASMALIYYLNFWIHKFPVIADLKN